MKTIKLITILLLLMPFGLYSQQKMLEFISSIPCKGSRKIDYYKVPDISDNKDVDLLQIDYDFKLHDEYYFLTNQSDDYLLYSVHEKDSNDERPILSDVLKIYLYIDKKNKKCFKLKYGYYFKKEDEIATNIINKECLEPEIVNSKYLLYIEELSNQYPFLIMFSLEYADKIFITTTVESKMTESYEVCISNYGEFKTISIYLDTIALPQKYRFLNSTKIDSNLQYNINDITYEDFLDKLVTLKKQIEEGRYPAP